jgi:hypothetical protein
MTAMLCPEQVMRLYEGYYETTPTTFWPGRSNKRQGSTCVHVLHPKFQKPVHNAEALAMQTLYYLTIVPLQVIQSMRPNEKNYPTIPNKSNITCESDDAVTAVNSTTEQPHAC